MKADKNLPLKIIYAGLLRHVEISMYFLNITNYILAVPHMISGQPNHEVTIDGQNNTCYRVKNATEKEYLLEHFALSVDHQGQRDIMLLGAMMANGITQCSMMSVFYSVFPAPNGCDISNQCSVMEDGPKPYYADPALVTCRFNCMCDSSASDCVVVAYTLYGEQLNEWQLCEIVIEI